MLTELSDKVKWNSLSSVFRNSELSMLIESLEENLNVVDESQFFSRLVNTSISKSQPFHRWVRYREGYAGELVKEILKRFPIDVSSDFVLDPMCGSGSTNVACNELNIDSIGLDVNPFAILATKVKTFQYDNTIKSLIIKCKDEIKNKYLALQDCALNEFDKSLAKYISERHLLELVKLKSIIKAVEDENLRDFYFLALLAIVEDCSDRKKDGNGLATRKSSVESVIDRFTEQCQIMIEDVLSSQTLTGGSIALCKSALNLGEAMPFAAETFQKSLGSIIFSPPYANSFDYFESYKLELVFGEYTLLDKLFDFRKELIRNYRLSYKKELKSNIRIVSLLCDEIWQRIPEKELLTGTRDGRTRLVPNMLCAYFDDMRVVLESSFAALKKGGMIHIVVDQSSYVGVPIPTDSILAFIGMEIGFKVKNVVKCRRAATSGQQLKQYPYLKELLRESIVTLVKE